MHGTRNIKKKKTLKLLL